MRIYLARHGETQVGEDGLYLPESGLTDRGHRQAKDLANALGDKSIQLAFSSGLLRARETAAHFETHAGIQVRIVEGLNEIDPGDIYSATEAEKQAIVSHKHGLDFTRHGGENPAAFSNRVSSGLASMVNAAEVEGAEIIAAFIHGGTVGAVLDQLAGVPFDYNRRSRMPNGAYAVIETAAAETRTSPDWISSHLNEPT